MISIYTMTYNEQELLPFMVNHYRQRFPNCKIIIYDNESKDNTVAITKENNCEVITFSTNNTIDEYNYLNIKNNCWKTSETDWVLVCDVDELLDISENDLIDEEKHNATIIRAEGYNMVSMEGESTPKDITYGYRAEAHDKFYLFNKKLITEINYEPGCHNANPSGIISFSKNIYKAYHYHFISEERLITRYKEFASRLSPNNIKNSWGFHYLFDEKKIKDEYKRVRNISHKIR